MNDEFPKANESWTAIPTRYLELGRWDIMALAIEKSLEELGLDIGVDIESGEIKPSNVEGLNFKFTKRS
jgi:hypothetical protein